MGSLRETDLLNTLKGHDCVVNTRYIYMGAPFPQACLSPLQGKRDREGQQDDVVHFVFEKATSDLHTCIYQQATNYGTMAKYMVQMALGVEFIHSRGIIHRDIKPNNILIFGRTPDTCGGVGVAKICDFGLAKPHTYQGSQTPDVITSWYRAPEVALGNPKYDGKVDIWSLGCVFFEMIARRALFNGMPDNNDTVISRILGKLPVAITSDEYSQIMANPHRVVRLTQAASPRQRMTFQEQLWPSNNDRQNANARFESQIGPGSLDLFCDLLCRMLAFDPLKRLTATQVVNHPFFASMAPLIKNVRVRASHIVPTVSNILISDCVERRWGMRLAREIFNRRHVFTTWYSDRILFQGMSLYDRYISTITHTMLPHPTAVESEDRGRYHTKFESELRFIVCMYIAIKYFSSIQAPVSYNVIANESFTTESALKQAEQFELNFVQNCLQYRVYQPTLYEEADRLNIVLSPSQVSDLVLLYTLGAGISGQTPRHVVNQYIQGHFNTTLASIASQLPKNPGTPGQVTQHTQHTQHAQGASGQHQLVPRGIATQGVPHAYLTHVPYPNVPRPTHSNVGGPSGLVHPQPMQPPKPTFMVPVSTQIHAPYVQVGTRA